MFAATTATKVLLVSALTTTVQAVGSSMAPAGNTIFNPRRIASTFGKAGSSSLSSSMRSKASSSIPETGWFSVISYVDEGTCTGSYITEVYEFGNCVVDVDNTHSMLAINGPLDDNLYHFNRTFYSDSSCASGVDMFYEYTLPSTCAVGPVADDDETSPAYGIYVDELTTKVSLPRRTSGYISWNSEELCATDRLDDFNYMLIANHKSCYPNTNMNITFESDDFYNGDDNRTAYRSMIVNKCNKVEYYELDNCEGDMITESGTIGDDTACEAEEGNSYDADMYSTYYCKDKKDSNKNVCFAGSETILLESGATKMMSEVAIGDRVQVYSADTGSTEFSDVIAVPHASNDVLATFVEINTASGSVKMTPDHLVAAGSCSAANTMLPLVRSEDVKVGDCVNTVEGQSMVSSINTVDEKGIYTIVTRGEFLVVGNIVASPFAVNHNILHFFYNLHRALPTGSPLVAAFHAVADQITKIAVLPVIRSVFAVSA